MPIRPQNSSYSFKYDITIAFFCLRSPTEAISKRSLGYLITSDSERGMHSQRRPPRIRIWPLASRPFRIAKLYWGRMNAYGPRYFPYGGLRHQIYQCLDMVKFAKIGLILKNRTLVFYGNSNPKKRT